MVPTSRIWNSDAFPPYFCNCSDLGELLVHCVPEFVQRPLSVRVLDLGNGKLIYRFLPPSLRQSARSIPRRRIPPSQSIHSHPVRGPRNRLLMERARH
jgi:hypothetical protein